jgi:hypothetical protein
MKLAFAVVEYGKNRKVLLPDSLKREILEEIGLRELRRRGIGQHTLEKALRGPISVKTYRKIMAAIQACKQEKAAAQQFWVCGPRTRETLNY